MRVEMKRAGGWLPAVAMVLVMAVDATAAGGQNVELRRLVGGLELPLAVVGAGDDSGRLFVVEQPGRVRILRPGGLAQTPFLDLSSLVSCCGERGLLDVAFHPDYSANGFFFVNYTAANGDSVVSRLSVSADPDLADPDSETEILRFAQPFANHNGGDLAFGPDGYLYVASGDGGSGGDPFDNGQSLDTLLGKILRLDVDALPGAIPPDNPFVGDAAARDEIWAYGLRNPWRISFDRETGDFFIADVGQNEVEEIDFQPAASAGGENYGWRRMEGGSCFEPANGCDDGTLTLPILEYGHDEGCSVTGGFRYRGEAVPALVGTYLYADFCSGRLWGATPRDGGGWSSRVLLESGLSVSSFGEDDDGELYVVDFSGSAGAVYQVVGGALFRGDFESGDTSGWKRRRPAQLEVVAPGLADSGFALAVSLEGAAGPSALRATRPRRESRLAVEFRLAANEVDLGGGEVEVLALVGRGRERHARLTLERRGARYRLNLYAVEDDGAQTLVGGTGIPRKRESRIAVEWSRASAPGAGDGAVRLLRKGRVRARATDLANGGLTVEEVAVGLPVGVDGPGSGSFLLDEFVIRR